MLPTTNFEEIYTYIVCPSKLLLKLSGYRSEIERAYTPPSVSPTLLGKLGEEQISNGYLRTPEVWSPELETEEITHPKYDFKQFVRNMTRMVKQNIKAVTLQCQDVSVRYLPKVITKLARDLKKQFGVIALLDGVNYTTIPHHYVGKVDFLGLKEEDEVVIIEAKNKAAKLNRKDMLQLEYYMAGLPRQYQFTKIYEHIHTLVAQLNPQQYLKYLSLMKRLDLMRTGNWNLVDIITDGLEQLSESDLEKFMKKYGPTKTSESYTEYHDEMDVAMNFLKTIPECIEFFKSMKETTRRISIAEKEFNQQADEVVTAISRGFKNGLLVDVRRQEIQDVPLTTNFDMITRGIWSVKMNAFQGDLVCIKNHDACNRCQYRKTCAKRVKEEGELAPIQSITSVVHKAFSKMDYDYRPPSLRTIFGEERITVHPKPAVVDFYRRKGYQKLSYKSLLKPALAKSEWGYKEWFSKKRRWKSLFADALTSKKLQLELNFWEL